jgi:hypothetical protein
MSAQVTITASGASGVLDLSAPGEYILQATSADAFVLDLQVSTNGTAFDNIYFDPSTKATLDSTGVKTCRVPAGKYRANVTTYNSTITLRATQCS